MNKALIQSYPAFDIYEALATTSRGLSFKAGTEFYNLKTMGKYKLSSVVSYALEYNEDPIARYNKCVERGHDTHYLVPLGSCLTSHKQERKEYFNIFVGMRFWFEGKLWIVEAAPNRNLNLRELEPEA